MPPRNTRSRLRREAEAEREAIEEQERVNNENARPASPFREGATPPFVPDNAHRGERAPPSPSLASVSALERETRLLLGRATDDQQRIFRGLWRHINAKFALRIDEPEGHQDSVNNDEQEDQELLNGTYQFNSQNRVFPCMRMWIQPSVITVK